MLRDPSVDAVVIATRHDSHASLALAALGAGKHVFLEKPMALRRAELDALRDAARASDRVFTVGYNRRYAPLALAVRDALAAAHAPALVALPCQRRPGSAPATGRSTRRSGAGGS